jgi:PAS domain S-box-containing protein
VGEGERLEAGAGSSVRDAASMRRFLDMSIDLLAVTDLETRVLELSESWERTLGWTRDDLLGQPLIQWFHEDDLPRIEAELAGLLVGGDAVAVVVRIRTKAGPYRWLHGSARSDLDAGRIYVTAADITERKQLEDALLRQVALEDLVATITGRLLAADDADVPEVIETSLGELACAMGANRGHFIRGTRRTATRVIEWLDPDTGQRLKPPLDATPEVNEWWLDVLRTGRLLRLDDVETLADEAPHVLEDLRRDGVRSVLHVPLPQHRECWGFISLVATHDLVQFNDESAPLLRLAGEAFLTALARGDDAAALLDARRELEHRNDELERSNEELERFAYAAAHDLKAPLARIEMALAATPRPEGDGGVLVDVARRGAGRMRQLIEDLLTFSAAGRSGSTPEDVDLDELLTQVLADLAPTIESSGAEVRREPLPRAWGHRSLLGQVLQNLVSNSLKFVREGATPTITITGSNDASGTTIRVADNGIGVDPTKRDEVFGVFTRLNSDDLYPGSGIGLATCAKVVAHHGGRIWLEDGIDGGAQVVVHLRPRPTDE